MIKIFHEWGLYMFFAEIDEDETCRQTRHFFNKTLDYYLNLSSKRRFNLSSPIITGMPKTKSNVNNQDRAMMRIFYAEKIVDCVSDAVNSCNNDSSKPYKAILVGCYFDHLSLVQIGKQIGYTSRQQSKLSNLKNEALLEFAERFEGIQQAKQIEPPIKLIAYADTGIY